GQGRDRLLRARSLSVRVLLSSSALPVAGCHGDALQDEHEGKSTDKDASSWTLCEDAVVAVRYGQSAPEVGFDAVAEHKRQQKGGDVIVKLTQKISDDTRAQHDPHVQD